MSTQNVSDIQPSKLMHDSIFEISRPQPMKHSRANDEKNPKDKKLFEGIRDRTLALIYGDKYNPSQETLGDDSLMEESKKDVTPKAGHNSSIEESENAQADAKKPQDPKKRF